MTAREYLETYGNVQEYAEKLREKYEELKARYDSAAGGLLIGEREKDINKPTERKVERVQTALAQWRKAALNALEIRQEIFLSIIKVEDAGGDILIERYIHLKKWEDVCEAVNLSWPAVRHKHRKALDELQLIVDNGAGERLLAIIEDQAE